MAFSTFSVLWDHHLSLVPERLHLPHWTTTERLLPPTPHPRAGQPPICLLSLWITCPGGFLEPTYAKLRLSLARASRLHGF